VESEVSHEHAQPLGIDVRVVRGCCDTLMAQEGLHVAQVGSPLVEQKRGGRMPQGDELLLESLRREIHEGLQVIETWNSANDFILYGKGGEFASNKLEDQEILMLSLHLLQVSLVYVNTLMIQQVLAEPEWQNRLTGVDLRALSPLKWRHVNPYGTFTLNMQERLPLEQVAQLPRATLPKFGASLPWGRVEETGKNRGLRRLRIACLLQSC
jgi:hypothetical protein